VITVSAANPPIGILREIDVEPVEEQLRPGDLLIMVTDGIYDAPRHTADKERWMKRLIAEIDTRDPQGFADCLLEKVIRYHDGEIADDMTVVVAKVEKHSRNGRRFACRAWNGSEDRRWPDSEPPR